MAPFPKQSAQSQTDVPALRSLGPEYDQQLHGRHAEVLLKVLSDKSPSAARNIALAGHYGSGKSSVILGVQGGLDERRIEWVNLSLSSLGIDDTKRARVQEDGTLAPLTNLIQKEIVKQLLYRKAPADMPGSRYFRIDSFRAMRALWWAVVSALGFFAIAVLLGGVDRVEKVAPPSLVEGRPWTPWLVVGLLGAFVGGVCFLALRVLQNRVRLDSVSAGGAAVSLSAKENSYFDEYLDEIVYFFQQTKTRVAIFEDLDRFKDPHIFETLRELNTVLNNSEQVKARPVRFVYAVRDSIFEQLEADADSETSKLSAGADAGSLRAAALESVPAANRTKFFDLVVPMVPFITHRSARDLLAAEFKDSSHSPSTELINLVGGARALTDMRLIRNIRNEFEIYQASVLSDKGLKGLTADRLFAMIVYKNTHLEDFEAIRLGTSRIDAAYHAFRDLVEHQASQQLASSRAALAAAQGATSWDERAQALGERLQRVLPILHKAGRRSGGEPQILHSSGDYPLSDLTSGKMWKELFETKTNVQLGSRAYGAVALSFDELMTLAGDPGLAMEDNVKADVAQLRQRSRIALETKEFVTKATMAELMARTDLTMPVDGNGERNLDEMVSIAVSPLAHKLLAEGYIDENFTLYCSDYHDVAISVSAMNFILHCVQADRPDPLFRFDNSDSIKAVENEMGDRFLGGESVFNVAVFDHYLVEDCERLSRALDRLVVRAAAGDTSFLDLYLNYDTAVAKDRLVSAVAQRWKGLLVHLVETHPSEQAVGFMDEAISSARRGIDYESSDAVTEFIAVHYRKMDAFTAPMEEPKAVDLVHLLGGLGVRISDLKDLGEMQRMAVVTAGLYSVTRANLVSALGDDRLLPLDLVKSHDDHIYDHVMHNLRDYLRVLTDGDVTVEDPGAFLDVLQDVADAPDSLVRSVARLASPSCTVNNLDELAPACWQGVVAADRFRTSVSNVGRYVSKHGVTPEVATSLVEHDLVDAEDLDAEERVALAYALVDTTELNANDRVRLVGQLQLSEFLDPSELRDEGLSLLPKLLRANEVSDDAETYAFIADRPFSIREDYFASSDKLASYVTELSLSCDDLTKVFASRRVSPSVKRAIADDPEFVEGRLCEEGAVALCEWATKGKDVSPELLVVLSQQGAPAEQLLGLLDPHLPDIDTDTLDAILRGLGDDYEPLTRTGHHRPRLKSRPGTEKLLDELKRRGRVSSYGHEMLGGIRVNMRR